MYNQKIQVVLERPSLSLLSILKIANIKNNNNKKTKTFGPFCNEVVVILSSVAVCQAVCEGFYWDQVMNNKEQWP